MRKSLSYKQAQALMRIWTRRLILGAAGSYAIALGVMMLFRHMGGDAMMIVGFLCVFVLMPVLLLLLFSLPSRRNGSNRASSRKGRTVLLMALPALTPLIMSGTA